MSTERNKATVRRFMEGYNHGNVAKQVAMVEEMFTADFVGHGFGPTRDDVKQFVTMVLTRAPENIMTIQDMIAEGDTVAVRFVVHGKDPATGQPADLNFIAIQRFVGDKFAEVWQARL